MSTVVEPLARRVALRQMAARQKARSGRGAIEYSATRMAWSVSSPMGEGRGGGAAGTFA